MANEAEFQENQKKRSSSSATLSGRTPEKYYQDQIKSKQHAQKKVEELRIKLEADEKENYTYKPKILESSKNYITSRNINNTDRDQMFERMYKEKETKSKLKESQVNIKRTESDNKNLQPEFNKTNNVKKQVRIYNHILNVYYNLIEC